VRLGIAELESPVGKLGLAFAGSTLYALEFDAGAAALRKRLAARFDAVEAETSALPARLEARLAAYLRGDVAALDAIVVETGGTGFQRDVWRALRDIPAGHTLSYAELARRIGRPRAVRAVGLANGANPVAIVVPCHRVIGADGTLTGYGGGLWRKRWLLDHEARFTQADRGLFQKESAGRSGALSAASEV
jgi:methylated-DNA-[protein]-cysteine S-methyltransferase